ncbi:UNVERIFIED_CONTAM: hypothetical protein FKN15_021985 [Acipenser sinensis]
MESSPVNNVLTPHQTAEPLDIRFKTGYIFTGLSQESDLFRAQEHQSGPSQRARTLSDERREL